MPRPQKGRGGKKRTRGKRRRNHNQPLRRKNEDISSAELYGKVTKLNGGRPCFVDVACEYGVNRRCVIRGKMTKRVYINIGDYILITYSIY